MSNVIDFSEEFKKGEMEARLKNVEKNVDIILTNHLPHLSDQIEKIHIGLSDKIDAVLKLITTSFGDQIKDVFIKLDNNRNWLIATLTSFSLALIALIFNLLRQ